MVILLSTLKSLPFPSPRLAPLEEEASRQEAVQIPLCQGRDPSPASHRCTVLFVFNTVTLEAFFTGHLEGILKHFGSSAPSLYCGQLEPLAGEFSFAKGLETVGNRWPRTALR